MPTTFLLTRTRTTLCRASAAKVRRSHIDARSSARSEPIFSGSTSYVRCVRATPSKKERHARAIIASCLALQVGGVYADTDTELRRPLRSIGSKRNDSALLSWAMDFDFMVFAPQECRRSTKRSAVWCNSAGGQCANTHVRTLSYARVYILFHSSSMFDMEGLTTRAYV